MYLFVGCLNRPAPYFAQANGVGLAVYRFDEEALSFEQVAEADDVDNPTFLTLDAAGRHVYVNSEVFGWKEGIVSAYRFDAATARLVYLNKQPTLGSISAYNGLSEDGRFLMVANYGMGEGGPDRSVAVFEIRADGSLAPAVSSIANHGKGVNPARQERSHSHCVIQLRGSGTVLVTDLGQDRIFAYKMNKSGELIARTEAHSAAGAGPRHMALHPDGASFLVSNELDSTVSSWREDADGTLCEVDVQTALPKNTGQSHSADIQVSPDGRFVYSSNRGHDSIAAFGIEASGRLNPVGHFSSGGRTPRNFAITPTGRHLVVANQDSDSIALLSRNPHTGTIEDTGRRIEIGTPMCVRLAGE